MSTDLHGLPAKSHVDRALKQTCFSYSHSIPAASVCRTEVTIWTCPRSLLLSPFASTDVAAPRSSDLIEQLKLGIATIKRVKPVGLDGFCKDRTFVVFSATVGRDIDSNGVQT